MTQLTLLPPQVTRSHKHNDRDHQALADGTATAEQHLPRYFAKSGYADADPRKTKKDGGGKGNWGREGDEIDDNPAFNLAKPRRRSNSSIDHAKDFKTKFEAVDPEPVFEEEIHGDLGEEYNALEHTDSLDKESTSDSSISGHSYDAGEGGVDDGKL